MKKLTFNTQSEYEIQRDAVRAIDLQFPGLLYCASAGGVRTSIGAAVKMKAAGYRKGFPDLFIYQPSGIYHGLAIEFKTVRGSLTPEQIEWGSRLTREGYAWTVCRTAEAAVNRVRDYLRGLPV